ncbi:hypothetical protein HBN50_12935 [Halobacteriovorax sp. GB3]|uniref:hypothetical protein n=1 Tax=Halobacteriovorax sp. GB3 TaxID=2719615 RepID=UPI00236249F8|nr:hypothetical protein [Halobacteriovorax sp. GB3]MDD0854010.1 hypothetical protein [Halobacteriovorax sp. GB3]
MSSNLAPHEVTVEEYKGNKIFKIYKVDDQGNELEKYGTIISFGITKAKYLLEHMDDIKKFVDTYSNE